MNVKKISVAFTLILSGIQFTLGQSAIDADSSKAKSTSKLMPAIEIKAVRAGKEFPFTQTVISKSAIEKNNLGQDIPFLLNQIPGAVANADAGNAIGYTGIRIRGTDPTRINFTLNGIAYNDAESQGVFLVNLPDILSSTNSIQVQRGVGTSSNGTGAFGATVNLLTNEVIEKAYGQISNSIGSFNSRKHTIKTGTGLINGRYTVDLRLSSIASDGFIDRSSSDLKSFYLSTARIRENSSLRLNIFSGKEKTYQAWYGIPEEKLDNDRTYNSAGTEKPETPYDNETDNYTQTHYQLFYNKKLSTEWNLSVAGFTTKGQGYYEQYKADESFAKYGLTRPAFNGVELTETDLIRQLWLDNIYFGSNFSLQHITDKNEVILGGGSSRYSGQHFGKIIWAENAISKDRTWYDHDAAKKETHIFGKWLDKVGPVHFFADLQVRMVSYTIDGFRDNPDLGVDRNWIFANPKFGARLNKNNFSAFISYAMANKEPNRDDFEAGATNSPKHETLHDFESGLETNLGEVNLQVNAYGMFYRNQLVLTGKVNDVGAYTRTNIAQSYRTGIEIEASTNIGKSFRISNNIALSRNKINALNDYIDDYDGSGQLVTPYNNTDIAFSPSVVNNASVSWIPWKNAAFRIISKYVGRQYLDNTSRKDRSLDAFLVNDLHFNQSIKVKEINSIDFFIQINNFLNTRYEPNGYTYSYKFGGEISRNNFYFPMAGTNFMVGCSINL